jgi:hypothetical protein
MRELTAVSLSAIAFQATPSVPAAAVAAPGADKYKLES